MTRTALEFLIEVTGLLILLFLWWLIVITYDEGRDFEIKGSKGRRLSKIEKFIDGWRQIRVN